MGNMIQVKVEGPSGTYPLIVRSNAKVRKLKKRYARAAREGVELEKVVLKYNDQALDDEKTLSEYSIQRNAVVEAEHVRVVVEEVSCSQSYSTLGRYVKRNTDAELLACNLC